MKINKTCLYLGSALIMLIGLGVATVVYLRAETASATLAEYEYEAKVSKMYVHDLELFGGKMNVITVELSQWLSTLWHGKALAYTIACIFGLISLGIFIVGRNLGKY